jgi:tetratricopeptide (TPR) repeat protein
MRFSIFLSVLILFSPFLQAQSTAGEFYQAANKAYEENNFSAFLSHLEKANELRPNHRTILYNLALAYTLNDQHYKAIEILKYRSSFYALNDFDQDEKLAPLKSLPQYQQLLSQIDEQNKPILNSSLHFEFEKKGFHPEGIAIHPESGNFLVSDVRCGLISSFKRDGSEHKPILDLKKFGYWGAMGMAFDKQDPNMLWVSTSALPNYCEYSDSLDGKSAVLKIDLKKKQLIRSYSVEGHHAFGDLVTTDTGTVYISDSSEPIVYKITEGNYKPEEFLNPEGLFNLQGLALGEKNTLYISDYITGVYSVDLYSKKITPVISETQLTRGTDGLYFHNGLLYLIQNGTRPFQVAKVDVSNSSMEIVDRAVPELNEPTLGVIKSGILYFIANSPWAFYDEENNPKLDEWRLLQIRKLNIQN